jgi:hypothetical protein
MSKPVLWLLIGIGFFLLIIGIFNHSLFIFGLILIGIGLLIGVGPDGILRKDQVLDTWAILIEKAQGNAEEIFRDTEGFIHESNAPCIHMERKSMSPDVVGGVVGKTRNFLTITDQENFRLRPYQIYINSRDYGDNLDVSWFLTYKPPFLQALCALLPFVNLVPKMLSDLDLFDQQDLRVYTTNMHHCLLQAVTKLMLGANQDSSKIDRKSRGFLGVT